MSEEKPLLILPGTVSIAATPEFAVRDRFTAGVDPGAFAKISYLDSAFETRFGERIEPSAAARNLCYAVLSRPADAATIHDELDPASKTTLADVSALLGDQKSGAPGVLPTNGCGAIFFVEDVTVHFYWDGGGWCIRCGQVAAWPVWIDGCRVFFRSSPT